MLRPLASSTSMKRGASGPGGWSNTMSTCRWVSLVLLLLLEVNVLRPDGAPSAAVLEEVEAVGDIVSERWSSPAEAVPRTGQSSSATLPPVTDHQPEVAIVPTFPRAGVGLPRGSFWERAGPGPPPLTRAYP